MKKTEIPDVKAAVVIPTYNNVDTIRKVVKDSIRTGLDVLIVRVDN